MQADLILFQTIPDNDQIADEKASSTSDLDCAVRSYRPDDFEIVRRIEMGDMATMLLGNVGRIVFYFCMGVYLFGDLAIYAAVVPKSLMNAICTYTPLNQTGNFFNVSGQEPCWPNANKVLTRMTVYRLLVIVFAILIGPFNFTNLSRTKYLQVITSVFRWSSFIVMIVWAAVILGISGVDGSPVAANGNKFTNLFGVSVYGFMCHHSLPGMVTPMKNKRHFFIYMVGVFIVIFLFYSLVSLTGAFAFADVDDVYTLTFFHIALPAGPVGTVLRIIQYALLLFPVFTISANYPIIGITLRNNLDTLIFVRRPPQQQVSGIDGENDHGMSAESEPRVDKVGVSTEQLVEPSADPQPSKTTTFLRRILLPLLITVLPLIFSLLTYDVTLLAAITGSYPGVGVQYLLPSWLSLAVRRKMQRDISVDFQPPYASPFKGFFWVYLSFFWAVCTVCIVTANYIIQSVS
ncbi:unnamed protein product [Soboliphyme baturini]|uniref:Aa_trans domain-containing protein n=1 Tax=Soboliphyme baturini TaxID=241478 RepID=A0A183JAQ7_9BILA|nr:unnamed protein product [Soboliphyme baturini]